MDRVEQSDKKITWQLCDNFPACVIPSDAQYGGGITNDGRRLCRFCSRVERERMARWLKAGSPTAAQSIAKMRAKLATTPTWRLQMSGRVPENFEPIGAAAEREPGSDDE